MPPPVLNPVVCLQPVFSCSEEALLWEQPVCRAEDPAEIDAGVFDIVDRAEAEVEREQADEVLNLTSSFEAGKTYPVSGNAAGLPRGARRLLEEEGAKDKDYEFSWEYAAGGALPLVSLKKIVAGKGPSPARLASAAQVVGGVAVIMMSDRIVDRLLEKFDGPQSLRGPLQFFAPMAVYDAGYLLGAVKSPSFSTFGRSMPALTALSLGSSHLLDAAGVKLGTDANAYGSLGLTFAAYAGARGLAARSPQFASAIFYGTGAKLSSRATILSAGELSLGSRAAALGLRAAGVVGAVMLVDTGVGWIIDGIEEANGRDPAEKIRIVARNEIFREAWCGEATTIIQDLNCATFGISKGAALIASEVDGDLGYDLKINVDWKVRQWIEASDAFGDWIEAVLPDLALASMTEETTDAAEFWENLESNLTAFYGDKPTTMASHYELEKLTGHASPKAREAADLVSRDGRLLDRGAFKSRLLSLLKNRLENTEGLFARDLVRLKLARFDGNKLVATRVKPKDYNGDQDWFTRGDGIHPSDGMRMQSEIKRLRAAIKILEP